MFLVLQSPCQLLDEADGLDMVEVHLPIAGHQWLARHSLNLSVKHGQAWEGLALEILQARATAGRDVTELVVAEAKITNHRGRVTTADDGQAIHLAQRSRYGSSACREAL